MHAWAESAQRAILILLWWSYLCSIALCPSVRPSAFRLSSRGRNGRFCHRYNVLAQRRTNKPRASAPSAAALSKLGSWYFVWALMRRPFITLQNKAVQSTRKNEHLLSKRLQCDETAPVKGRSHRVRVVYLCNNTSGREQGG
jgi:hypothetical protein